MIEFLNELFKGKLIIDDLVFGKNDHPGELKDEGGVIFDLHCKDSANNSFLVKVQRGKQENFEDSVFYYAARLISDQIPKGNRKIWNYKLQPLYVIAILEDSIPENTNSEVYVDELSFTRCSTGETSNKLTFKFIELTKFVKSADELVNSLGKWIFA